MAIRVFELAKELGVTSKAVLDKCRAEEIDLKNHMAVLSAGLEATIREWFTEGAVSNAVETTQHVDLEKEHVKAKRQRRRRGGEEEVPEQAPPAEGAAVETASPESPAEETVEAPPAPAEVAEAPAAPEQESKP